MTEHEHDAPDTEAPAVAAPAVAVEAAPEAVTAVQAQQAAPHDPAAESVSPPAAAMAASSPVAILADPLTVPLFQPAPADRLWRWGTIAAIAVLYLLNAGSFGLWDPWETHYGEVARNMVETFDWVNPWWGYARKIGNEPLAGEWFYSKPIYIFWAECTFIKLIGLTDWAFRLPQALLGIAAVASVYLGVERILTRQYAFWAAMVMGLSPFVYMVSRQAQTDLPFVATLTIGLMLMLTAMFGRRQPMDSRQFGRWTLAFGLFVLANLGPQFAIIGSDLLDPNTTDLLATIQQNGVWHVVLFYLPVTLAILGSIALALWRQSKTAQGWGDAAFADLWFRRYLLLGAYMLLAQSTYAKGLLGFMLPGAILVLYLLVSGQWRLLARLDLGRGIPLFFVTVLPWYVAMFCRHGMPYYQRFFIHDHFNRVGAGVHQIDTGTFEYFVEWLGYGLFPWSAFVPLALVALVASVRAEAPQVRDLTADGPRDTAADWLQATRAQLRSFAFLWFLLSFILFTLSSTRFHHYILPGVPPLAMLVAWYLVELRDDTRPRARLAVVLALALTAVLVTGILSDFQNLRSLFTYKYDRPMPENLPADWAAPIVWPSDATPQQTWATSPFGRHVGPMVAQLLNVPWLRFETVIKALGALTALSLLGMLAVRWRRWGLGLLTATAALLAFWTLNHYMPSLAPHWSQRYLFDAYYEDCHLHPNPPLVQEAFTPLVTKAGLGGIARFLDAQPKRVCKEDIVSWLITWRGETYYSNNEIRPLNKATQLGPYLQEMNKGKPFYVLAERGRNGSFEAKLKGESRKLRDENVPGFSSIRDWKCEIIGNDSAYFIVSKCLPSGDDPASQPRSPSRAPRLPKVPLAPEREAPSSPNPSF